MNSVLGFGDIIAINASDSFWIQAQLEDVIPSVTATPGSIFFFHFYDGWHCFIRIIVQASKEYAKVVHKVLRTDFKKIKKACGGEKILKNSFFWTKNHFLVKMI